MTSVTVYLHNETVDDLVLVDAPEPHGDWTGSPPAQVAAGDVVVFGTESEHFLVGTEGRATYRIGPGPTATVSLHWDNPRVGGNSFHTNASDSHYAFWSTSGGTDAVVHFVVRAAQTVETDFLPSRDGFRFSNSFGETPYTLPMLRDTPLDQKYGNAKNGLCGGMVFAALDYFLAGQRIPQTTEVPMGEQDPLFLVLVDRLFASFDPITIMRLLGLMGLGATDGDETILSRLGVATTRASVMAFEEWPRVRADIDAGRPSPICLQTVKSSWPGDLGENHQVLVYAYEAHGHSVTLRIYDPNTAPSSASPGAEDAVFMRFSDGDVSQRIVVEHNIAVADDDQVPRPIYCFLRMEYDFCEPRLKTEPRLTQVDVARRHVMLRTSGPVLTGATRSPAGRRQFDVFPDCGSVELDCELVRSDWRFGFVAEPVGFYDPVVTWTVGGAGVGSGGPTDLALAARGVVQPGPLHETRAVMLSTTADDRTLSMISRGDDGSYTVPVVLTCRERDDSGPAPWSRTYTAEIEGWQIEADGLAESNAQCLRRYLDARREGPPDDQGLADLVTARLSPRPDDPLWDPDPALGAAAQVVLAGDPRTIELASEARLIADLRADLIEPHTVPVAPHTELTPEEIKKIDLVKAIKDVQGQIGFH